MKWAGLWTRPVLLWEAIRVAGAFRARNGILPSRALLRWRLATAYGTTEASPPTEDVIRFLEWRRAWRGSVRRSV